MLSCILCRTNNNNHILDFRICNTANHIPLCVYTVSFTIFFRNPSSISFELFIPIFFRFIVRTIELTIHIFQIGEIEDERLLSALEKLKEEDLKILTLYAYDGYTVTEISKVLRCSQPTISIKIKRITKFLKNFEFDAMD